MAADAARVVERGGLLGGCCAPSAAKTKGNAASGRISTRFCRHCLTNLHAKYLRHTSDLPPARLIYKRVLGDGLKKAEGGILRASILDFRAKLENRCKVFPVYTLFRASILDFVPRLRNRCKVLPVYALLRASILDFRARLANRCRVFPVYALFRASILDFRPRLANR